MAFQRDIPYNDLPLLPPASNAWETIAVYKKLSEARAALAELKEGDIESTEVQDKSRAAMEFCKHASDYTTKNHGKPWNYVLIPHGAVQVNMSFRYLVKNHEVN